jgi:hypothetical protein
MKSLKTAALAALVASVGGLSLAAPAPKDKPKEGEGPVAAKLVAKKATYTLDFGGMTAEQYAEAIKEGGKTGKLPKAPEVDLVLELTNTGDKDVQIWSKGDAVRLELQLKGPGAVSVEGQRFFTREFRAPVPMTLAPGKTHTIAIKSLQYGFRGMAQQAYWTKPGEYTLGAAFQTGMSPPPAGAKEVNEGFAPVKISADPVKITVEEAK